MTASTQSSPRAGSGEMFDRIAARYDLLNRIMSLGMDRSWRRKLVASLEARELHEVLDLATGTADVALDIARRYPEAKVTGVDPSGQMLVHGQRKLGELAERVRLVQGDGQCLPFEDDRFDAACISFGIRNVPDRLAGLREMTRVTRPGGVVAVLELGEPREGILAPFARLHVRHVVPRLGALISGDREYRYLASSVAAFPAPEAFLELMEEAGLGELEVVRMSFDAAHLYTGRVPY